MAFSLPNEADAAFAPQAAPDAKDIEILVGGYAGTGVLSGCAVTAQGSPDMTLAVAAGNVSVGGVWAAVAAGNVTITTADATNPRFDLVVASSSGTKSVVAGAPAAAPVFPAIPASSAVLAAVYVPANDTAIGSTQIVDKRVILTGDWVLFDSTLGADAASFDFTGIPAIFDELRLYAILRTTRVATADAIEVRLNNDSGTNYSYSNTDGNVTGVTSLYVGRASAASAGSGQFGVIEERLPNYASSTQHKFSVHQGGDTRSSRSQGEGCWASTAVVDRVTLLSLSGNMVAGSRCVLTGIKYRP